MNVLKRLCCFSFAVVFALCCALDVFAYNIDGIVDADYEWKNTEPENLAQDGDTGNSINFLLVRYDLQTDKGFLYFAIQTIERGTMEDYEKYEFDITINNVSTIIVSHSGAEYDTDRYSVKTAVLDCVDGVCLEGRVSFKEGVGEEVDFGFFVTDSHGDASYQFNVLMKDVPDFASNATTAKSAAEKTTANKSTKSKNSSAKTSGKKSTTVPYSTVASEQYSTVKMIETETEASQSVQASANTQNENNSTLKTVLKTISVCILVVGSVAFATTLWKKKKQ